MKDLKNLSKNKRSRFQSIFGSNNSNRRISPTIDKRRILPEPSHKKREALKLSLLFIAIVIAATPIIITLIKKTPDAAKSALNSIKSFSAIEKPVQAAPKKPGYSLFEEAALILPSATEISDSLVATTSAGEKLKYSIDADMQKRVHDFMEKSKVPYSVFVAIEPSTGRILSMTSYSSIDPAWEKISYFNLYPMASLFKIITASAAIENRKLSPNSVIEFRGNSYSENPKYWDVSPYGKNNKMDATFAMGKSINPVYGRIAADIAGKKSVMETVNRFGFNQKIFPEIPVKESVAGEPASDRNLMLMGAGLDHEVKISPLHAAVIMAAVANRGKMMNPSLVDFKGDNSSFTAKEIRALVSENTAESLKKMLSTTVTSGTSRKAFHRRNGRMILNVDVAAKTGSINGNDPKGHYSWFAAFAPMDKPEIALVALVINQDKWKIKSAQIGAEALDQFFNRRGGKP